MKEKKDSIDLLRRMKKSLWKNTNTADERARILNWLSAENETEMIDAAIADTVGKLKEEGKLPLDLGVPLKPDCGGISNAMQEDHRKTAPGQSAA